MRKSLSTWRVACLIRGDKARLEMDEGTISDYATMTDVQIDAELDKLA